MTRISASRFVDLVDDDIRALDQFSSAWIEADPSHPRKLREREIFQLFEDAID
jgi:hypothetical protein